MGSGFVWLALNAIDLFTSVDLFTLVRQGLQFIEIYRDPDTE